VLAQIEFDGDPGEGHLGWPAVQQRAVEEGPFDEVESVLFAVGGDLGRRSVVDMEFVEVGDDPPVVRPDAHLFPDERGIEILVPRGRADIGEFVPGIPHHFHGRTRRRVRAAFDVAYRMEAFDSQLPVITRGIERQRNVTAHHGNEA
jgi:hypothetical protein